MGSLGLVVPPHSLTWYGPGERPTGVPPGSILLVDRPGVVPAALRFGQAVEAMTHPEIRGFTWNSHVGLVIGDDVVSEMDLSGHRLLALATYDDLMECVVELKVDAAARDRVLANDRACHGVDYGWVQYPFFVADALGAKFLGGWGSTMVCSTHVTMCAMGAGLFPSVPPNGAMPAHLSAWFGAATALAPTLH